MQNFLQFRVVGSFVGEHIQFVFIKEKVAKLGIPIFLTRHIANGEFRKIPFYSRTNFVAIFSTKFLEIFLINGKIYFSLWETGLSGIAIINWQHCVGRKF